MITKEEYEKYLLPAIDRWPEGIGNNWFEETDKYGSDPEDFENDLDRLQDREFCLSHG